MIAAEFDYIWKKDLDAIKMMGTDDDAIVKFEEFKVEINVLGLRGLASPGLLPVKKAFIRFMLKSLIPPMAASSVETVETQPGPAGPDPTINTVVSFNMLLPVKELYAPFLACRVYDKIFKGFDGALVGTFSIPIGDILFKARRENIQDMLDLDVTIQELEKIKDGVGVITYDTYRPDVPEEVKDSKFLDVRKKDKQAEDKAMVNKKPASLSSKVLPAALAPKPEKKSVKDLIVEKKTSGMRKRLLSGTDDDSDEEGNEYTNPVAKAPANYVPPPLNLNFGINEDDETKDLAGTPRSQMSNKERRQVDAEAVAEVINQDIKSQRTVSKNKNVDDPNLFQPVSSPRMSPKMFEDAIRRTSSGANTPTENKVFDKVQAGVTK